MRKRLVISYLILVTVALALFTVPVAISSSQLLRSTLEQTAVREARLFVPLVLRSDAAAATAISDRTRDFQTATRARVRLVRTGETVDSRQVDAALAGTDPKAVWGRDAWSGIDGVSVVVPVRDGGRVVAAVQVVSPSDEVNAQIRGIWTFRIAVGLGVLAASGVIAVLLAGSVVRPLRRLQAVARRLGVGDWSARADEEGPPEIVSLAKTLNESAATTESLLASQRAFVADASHQLRTPLTSITLSLDNIHDATDDPDVSRQVHRVEGEVARMTRMVEGLLALARTDAPAAPAATVELRAVVCDRREVWAPAFATAGVRWETVDDQPVSVRTTPGALEQVIDNVVDNALRVAPHDSSIDIAVRKDGGRAELVMRDHGPGMTDEQRARAFDRFWRAGPAGTGSGLGLAIVRNLVERDGGTIALQSPDDGGLSVVVSLPAVD